MIHWISKRRLHDDRHVTDVFDYSRTAKNGFSYRFVRTQATISNDMPEAGGGGAGVQDGPPVAATDDDDGGDGDPEPDRRRPRSNPSFPPALLRLEFLSHYIGFGRSRIYQLIGAGEFPPPIKVGKSSRWVKTEIDAWLSSQIAARPSTLNLQVSP